MTNGNQELHRHFILQGVTETEPYRSWGRGGRPQIPTKNRDQHGRSFGQQIEALRLEVEAAQDARQAAEIKDGLDIQVEFESFPDIEFAFESLARERSGIELLNVRHEDGCAKATVFVPDGKLDHMGS